MSRKSLRSRHLSRNPVVGDDQQDVPDPKRNQPKLSLDPLARPVDGQHRRLIPASKISLTEGLPDEHRLRPNHDLEVAGPTSLQVLYMASLRRDQAPDLLEIEDIVGFADESKTIPAGQGGFGRDGRHQLTGSLQSRQEDAIKMTESGRLDRFAVQGSASGHDHVQDEVSNGTIRLGIDRGSIG